MVTLAKQWEKRVKLTELIYTFLILDATNNEMKQIYEDADFVFDADFLKILEYVIDHMNDIIAKLKPNIAQTWTWERISFTDRAVLIAAVAEFEAINTPKKIVIDQSLITARNFNIDDSYKFINPILDKVLKNA